MLGEELLRPGEPLFEYWGHEASWIPIELYPAFEWRRREYRHHPWWGDLIGEHPEVARELMRRIRDEGPLRSIDLEGKGGSGWWQLKTAKKVATALWSAGELAIRERRAFQRTYDLTERVIPERWRKAPLAYPEALKVLLLQALSGHGWATTGTLAATWRLRNRPKGPEAGPRRTDRGRRDRPLRPRHRRAGRPEDRRLGAAGRPRAGAQAHPPPSPARPRRPALAVRSPALGPPAGAPALRLRPAAGDLQTGPEARSTATTASPSSPATGWWRGSTSRPTAPRGTLRVLSCHYEASDGGGRPAAQDRAAADSALASYSASLGLAHSASTGRTKRFSPKGTASLPR